MIKITWIKIKITWIMIKITWIMIKMILNNKSYKFPL